MPKQIKTLNHLFFHNRVIIEFLDWGPLHTKISNGRWLFLSIFCTNWHCMSRLRVTTGLQHFLTPSDHFHDLPYSAQILSFCPTTILPEILSSILIYLIIPLCTTDRPLLATHPMILISWKRPAMNLSFFYFLEESWFWPEGERGFKQVDKRISFQSLCLDLQLKFDQYLCIHAKSGRYLRYISANFLGFSAKF